MNAFGTDADIQRVVEQYSSMLLRLACTRLTSPMDAEDAAPEDASSQLLSAVRALPGPYSAVIHLYYYEGYSIKEIAGLLGLPAATVGTRLARGRKRLRELLKEACI